MNSVNVMDLVEASSSYLRLPPEEGINQVGYTSEIINFNSWQNITDFILDVIKILNRGAQEIPTSTQL